MPAAYATCVIVIEEYQFIVVFVWERTMFPTSVSLRNNQMKLKTFNKVTDCYCMNLWNIPHIRKEKPKDRNM